LRLVLVIFSTSALLFALNSRSTMYEMVQTAYNVTLTGAFVPLFAGAYWKRANTQGAVCAVVFGIGTWLVADTVAADALVPPNLVGFAASVLGMLLGTLAPQILANKGMSIERAIESARQGETHRHAKAHSQH
jgi:solute:Na+ symporter, SSS family